MTLAFKRLKNLGWVALVFVVLISLYPLSLSVGALRSNLDRTESEIVRMKKEMRYLETEFATRASMQQLEQWNQLEYGYSAPTAAQFLNGERALANLGEGHDGIKKPVRVASLTIDGEGPAGIIGSAFGDGTDIDPSSRSSNGSKSDIVQRADKKPVQEKEPESTSVVPEATMTDEQKANRRRAQFAQQMDIKLLTPTPKISSGGSRE